VENAKPATQQWQKFVAATDTAPNPPPPADDDIVTAKSSVVTSKSVSTTSVEAEQKDEIDMKLQDFLAVSRIFITRCYAARFKLWPFCASVYLSRSSSLSKRLNFLIKLSTHVVVSLLGM